MDGDLLPERFSFSSGAAESGNELQQSRKAA